MVAARCDSAHRVGRIALAGLLLIATTSSAPAAFRCTVKAREVSKAVDNPTVPPMKPGQTAVISSVVVQKDGSVGMCGKFLGCFDATKLSFVAPCGFVTAEEDGDSVVLTTDE